MRVGAYIDGFNLYYGARSLCGRGQVGWRWLDVRSLVESLLPHSWRKRGAELDRVVYCTARVGGSRDPSSARDQDVYIRALRTHESVDHVEFGNFVSRIKHAPLAVRDSSGKPEVVKPNWPVCVQDGSTGVPLPDTAFIVSYVRREEKGSDVNVATHLLTDVLTGRVDGAIVVSNDSDLRMMVGLGSGSPTIALLRSLHHSPGPFVGRVFFFLSSRRRAAAQPGGAAGEPDDARGAGAAEGATVRPYTTLSRS